MKSSDLRHIIKFQSPTTASDGMGGRTASEWVTDKTVRAHIMPIGSTVSYDNGQTRGVRNFEITTRYAKDYNITNKMRILWGTRILTPNVPINVDSVEKWLILEASEFTG